MIGHGYCRFCENRTISPVVRAECRPTPFGTAMCAEHARQIVHGPSLPPEQCQFCAFRRPLGLCAEHRTELQFDIIRDLANLETEPPF